MSNSTQGKDVLANFQPMPKRFMVWDRKRKTFRVNNGNGEKIFGVGALISFFLYQSKAGIPYTDFDLIQSTNLFDDNGKEIFEGSILSEPKGNLWIVQYDDEIGIFRTHREGLWDDLVCGGDFFKVIGHIFSNPELLEEMHG